MKSKTSIEKGMQKKGNTILAETILHAKKKEKWLEVSSILSGSRRTKIQVNLEKIDAETKTGETVVIPGKVLGKGDVSKKIRIVAFAFSQSAIEKLGKTKSEAVTILEEIKKNPNAKGIKIIKQ